MPSLVAHLDRVTVRWLLLVPIAIGLVVHSLVYNYVSDDAYISFVYARNFAEHGQIVFNLGDYVEGYTNFLWTLLLGLLMVAGVPPEIAARVLGTAFGIGTLIVTMRLCERLRGGPSLWDVLPAALLAASSGFAAWCSGGLETQMFTFLCVLAIWRVFADDLTRAGVFFALAAMTRPEALLVFAVVVLHRLCANAVTERRILPRRAEWLCMAAFLALYVPYFVWRWWYYGYLFPNTAYVKAGGTSPNPKYAAEMLSAGAFYVWQWATQSKALFAAPLALVAVWRHPRFGSLALLITASYLGYAWRVGGDFMGLHRFVMPLFVLTALLAGLGLAAIAERIPRHRVAAGAALAAALLGVFVLSQVRLTKASLEPKADHGIDRPGYLKQYAEDRAAIGKALAKHIKPDELSFVGGVGVQPYYARMRAYDVFGLVSEEIAHDVPPTRSRPGHQKWAPPEMVLKYDPTFIFYCYQISGSPSGNRPQCGELGYFRARGYEEVTMFIPGARKGADYYTFLKKKDRAWP